MIVTRKNDNNRDYCSLINNNKTSKSQRVDSSFWKSSKFQKSKMGNTCCASPSQKESILNKEFGSVNCWSDSAYEILEKPTIYKWTHEIERVLFHRLQKELQFPIDVYILLISFIDKKFVVYDENAPIKYPIGIPNELLSYPIITTNTNRNINTNENNDTDSISIIKKHRIKCGIYCDYSDYYHKDAINELFTNHNTFKIENYEISFQTKNITKNTHVVNVFEKNDYYIHLCVFAMDDIISFIKIKEHVNEICQTYKAYGQTFKVILIGNMRCSKYFNPDTNKYDYFYRECVVSDSDALYFAEKKLIPFVQICVEDEGNINMLFEIIARYASKCKDLTL